MKKTAEVLGRPNMRQKTKYSSLLRLSVKKMLFSIILLLFSSVLKFSIVSRTFLRFNVSLLGKMNEKIRNLRGICS